MENKQREILHLLSSATGGGSSTELKKLKSIGDVDEEHLKLEEKGYWN